MSFSSSCSIDGVERIDRSGLVKSLGFPRLSTPTLHNVLSSNDVAADLNEIQLGRLTIADYIWKFRTSGVLDK